jgi:hypothetical protein
MTPAELAFLDWAIRAYLTFVATICTAIITAHVITAVTHKKRS